MKTKMLGILTISAALLGTALSSLSVAQDRGRGFDGQGPPRGAMRGPMRGAPGERRTEAQPERFIERHDTDADGQVSEMEFVDEHLQNVDELFDRRDANGDGLISDDEHDAPPLGRPGREPRGPRGDRPDRPEIDREAVIACVRETVADYDPELDRPLEEIFDAVDTNGDGMLSLIEVSTALETRAHNLFARIDSDGNGYITEDEVAAHFEDQLNMRRVVAACVQEQLEG